MFVRIISDTKYLCSVAIFLHDYLTEKIRKTYLGEGYVVYLPRPNQYRWEVCINTVPTLRAVGMSPLFGTKQLYWTSSLTLELGGR